LCLILIAIVFQTIHRIETKQISCEKITIYDYVEKRSVKDCHMDKTTSIDSPNITIFTRDNSMERLFLEHNKKIFYLPDKIGDAYPNLIVLRAANCSIKEITSTNLRNLAELEELYLKGNQIERIASGAFKSLEKLNELHLQNQQIKEVVSGAFKGLIKLKNLYLHFNKIEKIASGAFEGMAELQELHLYRNQIKEIKNGAFKGLTKLKELHLYYNQIEKVQSDIFEDMKLLETLALRETTKKLNIFKIYRFVLCSFRLQQNQIFERKSFSISHKDEN
jgi:Leucine-rich repeat (LRR) protein